MIFFTILESVIVDFDYLRCVIHVCSIKEQTGHIFDKNINAQLKFSLIWLFLNSLNGQKITSAKSNFP